MIQQQSINQISYNQHSKNTQEITALYSRLSRDDELYGDSSSIQTQKAMLLSHAKQLGLVATEYYVDDGYSGTNFNRPDFKRLIEDIEQGKVRTVIVKDLSRFGRDYLQTGMYTEHFFPDHDVRFIAIDDNVDSAKGENEFAPFKNIMNEWYAKDVSRKVRGGLKVKAQQGLYTGSFAPYGYSKHPDNKHKLIPHEETAAIVKSIFAMISKGMSPYNVAMYLRENKVKTPREVLIAEHGIFADSPVQYPNSWCDSTVYRIVKNRVYLGHIVSQKSTTKSYKHKKRIVRTQDDWIEVKNTHEPLVSEELFEIVQQEIKVKRVYSKSDFVNLLAGKVFCVDCGKPLNISSAVRNKHAFTCSMYKRHGKEACGMHYIQYKTLCDILLEKIRQKVNEVQADEEYFLNELQKAVGKNSDTQRQQLAKTIAKAEKRIADINTVVRKLYEDSALGKITDEQFAMLSSGYVDEQKQLQTQLITAKKDLATMTETQSGISKFVATIQKYKNLDQLDQSVIIELIDKIIIHDGVWADGSKTQVNGNRAEQGNRTQQIDIYYNFIGDAQITTSQTQAENQFTKQIKTFSA